MKPVIDQYNGDTTYAHLQALSRDFPEAREILKTASFNKEAAEQLPDAAFAWEDARRFPIHTKADTVASIFYRKKVASYVPPEVDDRLVQAAQIYGIKATDFSTVKEAATTPEPEYALPSYKRLPLGSAEQVKLAEEVLHRDHERLTLETKADAYSRLVKAAAVHDVEVKPLTYKLAGLTACNNYALRDWLEARVQATDNPLCKEAFQKLATQLRKAGPEITNRKDLVKLASAISTLDQQAGLTKYYDRKLPDPLLTVFNTEKVAEEQCDVAGKKVACSKLMGLPDHVWEQMDVPELSKLASSGNLTEFKQVFDTLPADLKVSLRSYV